MADVASVDITELLVDWAENDGQALGKLIPLVYEELHRLASSYLRREWRGQSLGETSLIHEAYLRLAGQKRVRWRDRHHFFGTAALIMRRLVVDHARRHLQGKRLGHTVPIEQVPPIAVERASELVDLNEALVRLANMEPELAEIVDLRFFAGLSQSEIAELLAISVSTVRRRWRCARDRLHRFLDKERGDT